MRKLDSKEVGKERWREKGEKSSKRESVWNITVPFPEVERYGIL